MDVAAYDNGDHVAELYLNPALRPPGGRLKTTRAPELRSRARPVRYRLDLATGRVTEEELAPITVELPTIDYLRLNGRRYRHFYSTGLSDDRGAIFYDQLASVDTVAGSHVTWRQSGHFPGEPVFVRRPGASTDNDGILLSVVLDGGAAAPTCSPLTRGRWNRGPELSCRTMCPAGSTALFFRRLQDEPSEKVGQHWMRQGDL